MGTVTLDANTPIFPVTPNYGFIARPRYRTQAAERESGYERVNRLWSRPLHYYASVPLDDTTVAENEALRDFYHAMGGPSTYFKFKDQQDYKSCSINAAIAPTDQPLVLQVGSSTIWQLVRNYTIILPGGGTLIQVREIYKPKGSTIRIANGSAVEQSDWTLDEANGTITKGGSFSGTPTSWGGEYYAECRFENDGLDIEISGFAIRSAKVQMRERRRSATT